MARLLKTTPDTSQIGLKVLKHLITPSWYDKDGKTALQIAESAGQEAAIKYLEAWVCCPKKRCPPPFYRFQFLWSESTLSELFTYVFEGAQCMPDLATVQIWSNLCVSLNLWKLKSLALINMQRWEEYSLAHRTWLKLLPQRAKTKEYSFANCWCCRKMPFINTRFDIHPLCRCYAGLRSKHPVGGRLREIPGPGIIILHLTLQPWESESEATYSSICPITSVLDLSKDQNIFRGFSKSVRSWLQCLKFDARLPDCLSQSDMSKHRFTFLFNPFHVFSCSQYRCSMVSNGCRQRFAIFSDILWPNFFTWLGPPRLWMEHASCLSLPWLFGWTSWHLQVGMRHGLGSAFALLIKSCVCIMQWKYLIKEFFQVKSSRTRTAPETLLYPLQNGFHRVSQTSRHRGCGELQTRAPWDFQRASKDFQSKCMQMRQLSISGSHLHEFAATPVELTLNAAQFTDRAA